MLSVRLPSSTMAPAVHGAGGPRGFAQCGSRASQGVPATADACAMTSAACASARSSAATRTIPSREHPNLHRAASVVAEVAPVLSHGGAEQDGREVALGGGGRRRYPRQQHASPPATTPTPASRMVRLVTRPGYRTFGGGEHFERDRRRPPSS